MKNCKNTFSSVLAKDTDKESLYQYIKKLADKNNYEIVLNIPHSSIVIPKSGYNDCSSSSEIVARDSLNMSDIGLVELFKSWNCKKVIAKYSRVYVDCEKYWNDEDEMMAKFGLGAIYTNDIDGNKLHKKSPSFIKEAKKYYDSYHQELKNTCLDIINAGKEVLLLDIHSFSNKLADFVNPNKETTNLDDLYPDICIGYNTKENNEDIIKTLEEWFKKRNCSIKENFPYVGSIMPNLGDSEYKSKIHSVMIEINKRKYLY